MYLSNRLYTFTGLVLIAIAIGFVLTVVLSGAASSNDATIRADVPKYLQDIYDHSTLFIVSLGIGVFMDSGVTLLIAGLTYLVFRDRSPLLATMFLVAFVGSSILSCVSDALNASTVVLAKDFAHGGAGVSAGDSSILETTHIVVYTARLVGDWGGTMLAIAFFTLGWLIARAPEGRVNPPRAIGWIILVAGVGTLTDWAQFATDAAFLSFVVFGIATLVFTIWLGVWLILNSSKLPLPEPTTA